MAFQKISVYKAPPERRVLLASATCATTSYDQKSAALVDDCQDYGAWGYYVISNKACSVDVYCAEETSAGCSAGNATNYMLRAGFCLAADTFASYEYTAGPRFWYVEITPDSTAAGTHLGTYKVNI